MGSGTGILGMTVHKLLPHAIVVLTDGDAEALDLLRRNLDEPSNHINSDQVKARLLRWGVGGNNDDDGTEANRIEGGISSFGLWCEQSWPNDFAANATCFDSIVAGDVLYKLELPALFFETVYKLLNPAGGTLLLCHIPRAAVSQDIVHAAALSAGFHVVQVWTAQDLQQRHTQTEHEEWIVGEHCPVEDFSRVCIYGMKKG